MASVEIFREDPSVTAYPAGQVIFSEGAPAGTMYVVVEGEVELRRASGSVLAVAGPGDVFGELALIDDRPRSASAVARTDVRVAPIDARRFRYLVRNTPYFAIEVMRTMAERLRLGNAKAAG
jgi:CRP-like cAMP-binding protein